jgi:thymidylate kinase
VYLVDPQDYSPYKIGFVGSHGTGKTSLVHNVISALRERNIEAGHISEIGTKAREMGIPINETTNLAAQMYILHEQCRQELRYQNWRPNGPNYQVMICDRTVWDNLCYLERAVGSNENVRTMVTEHARLFPYRQLYYLPITSSNISEGSNTRSTDRGFQREMDERIKRFLAEMEIPYIALPVPVPEDAFRRQWVTVVVNQTLLDLEVSPDLRIPENNGFPNGTPTGIDAEKETVWNFFQLCLRLTRPNPAP